MDVKSIKNPTGLKKLFINSSKLFLEASIDGYVVKSL